MHLGEKYLISKIVILRMLTLLPDLIGIMMIETN